MFPWKPIEKLTKDQWQSFNDAKRCYICLKEFSEDDIKVRDHCHYTGLYHGPAHRSCNLQYTIPKSHPNRLPQSKWIQCTSIYSPAW